MKLSHSKLTTILSCPMTYYLSYEQGISLITEKPALYVGSAVHWGIEHNTEDLTEYFNSEQSEYTRDQLLSEAMVHGYLKHKDELFAQILSTSDGGKLTLENETHELFVSGSLPSRFGTPHEFIGIVDLLLLTDKGFIIIDYKTSSTEPDWNNYLDQIYRYIFLLRSEYPDVPIVKIGIVNIKKTNIRQKKGENVSQFMNRMRFEYDLNDENYVNYHEYTVDELDPALIDAYIVNLSKMADFAQSIVDNKLWFINYANARGQYGKSQFFDIFYNTPDAYLLYKIRDTIIGEDGVQETRECRPIDMLAINDQPLMNHYTQYKEEWEALPSPVSSEAFHAALKAKYTCDDYLLEKYAENLANNI